MKDTRQLKIPPADSGHNAPETPVRGDLIGPGARLLHRGSRTKADLFEVDATVVKDFAGKPWWFRWFGRLQIARECRAYRRLGRADGFPRFVDRVDAHALALGKVEAIQLIVAPTRFSHGADYLAQIRACLDRLHAAGIFHLDLRGRHNVVLTRNHRIVVLDLASAICLRPGSLIYRLVSSVLAAVDGSAYLKWKWILEVVALTEDEQRSVERLRFWRSLWVLNRKGNSILSTKDPDQKTPGLNR